MNLRTYNYVQYVLYMPSRLFMASGDTVCDETNEVRPLWGRLLPDSLEENNNHSETRKEVRYMLMERGTLSQTTSQLEN